MQWDRHIGKQKHRHTHKHTLGKALALNAAISCYSIIAAKWWEMNIPAVQITIPQRKNGNPIRSQHEGLESVHPIHPIIFIELR